MTDDPLELLARANPVPATVPPPPIDRVIARLEAGASADDALSQPARRPRPARFAASALAVAIALAVAAAAIVLVHSGARSRPSATGTPGAGTAGLLGQVAPTGVALGPGGTAVISVIQCRPCHPRMLGGPVTWTYRLWTNGDGGGSWQVTKRRWFLEHAVFSGDDGWASGIANDPYPDARVVFVTHDGGRTWKRVSVPKSSRWSVSIAGGEVWATADACLPRQGCGTVVLRGAVMGDKLRPVQRPWAGDGVDQIAAASTTSAYIYVQPLRGGREFGAPVTFTTRDGGRSWRRVYHVCVGAPLVGDGHGAIWQSCGTHAEAGIGRSTDGGHSWKFTRAPFGLKVTQLVPISATVAWAMTDTHAIVRTTDGGRTWTRTPLRFPWPHLRQRGGTDAPGTIPPPSARLAATSANDAELVTTQTNVDHRDTRSTMLQIWHTHDGGISWHLQVVGVPQR